jgi:uncharacterized membrane protein YhhN
MTVAFLALAAAVGLVDWVAVARGRHRIELAAKPLTLALLIAAAAAADIGPAKPWVVVALALGLLGDVALLFSATSDPPDGGTAELQTAEPDAAFLVGLCSFLLGHAAWIVAFIRHGVHTWQLLAGVLVVGGAVALVAPRVLRGARAAGGEILAGAVAVYSAALAATVVLAFGTTAVATAVGGALFLASDTTLAWDRFVHRLLRGQVIVMVTYHLAQALLLVGLVRRF